MLSSLAVNKSKANGFTAEQHFAVASDIDNLYRNSVKVLTHNDKNNDQNIAAIHRFVAPTFGDNAAYITIKEATAHGKRIYSVEVIELGKLEGHVNESRLKSSSNPSSSIPNENTVLQPTSQSKPGGESGDGTIDLSQFWKEKP